MPRRTSSGTAFIESAAGIEAGGRTGLTAVVTAFCFLPCLFFSPLAQMVPGFATAPILILVGSLMFRSIGRISFQKMEEALPAFLTLALIPFTFSITQGILWGFMAHVVLYALAGRAHGRQRSQEVRDHHEILPLEQREHRRGAAFVRHVHEAHFRHRLKELHAQVRGAALPARRVRDAARLRTRERDELAHVLRGQRRMDDEHVRGPACHRDVREILERRVMHDASVRQVAREERELFADPRYQLLNRVHALARDDVRVVDEDVPLAKANPFKVQYEKQFGRER